MYILIAKALQITIYEKEMKYHPLLLLMLTCYFTAVCTEKLKEFKCMHDASQNQVMLLFKPNSQSSVLLNSSCMHILCMCFNDEVMW